jgi:hypothetical protein
MAIKWVLKDLDVGVDWIKQDKDKDRWWIFEKRRLINFVAP